MKCPYLATSWRPFFGGKLNPYPLATNVEVISPLMLASVLAE
jgi:hypothetical protein